ncbi:MAG: dTMP kinase [bacterium]|nr:dTMP kinase [bacterium]
MSNRGRYIVLEGDEGAGKGEQVKRLLKRLVREGITCEIVREPGGDPIAEQLREILKFSESAITPLGELFGFLMARAQVLELVVKPLLEQGSWVLSDRSSLSTYVYQGEMRGLLEPDKPDKITQFLGACQLASQVAIADITLVLDISYEQSQQRLAQRGGQSDRFESIGEQERRLVNKSYRKWAEELDEVMLLDGSLSIEEVERSVWAHIEPMIEEVGK